MLPGMDELLRMVNGLDQELHRTIAGIGRLFHGTSAILDSIIPLASGGADHPLFVALGHVLWPGDQREVDHARFHVANEAGIRCGIALRGDIVFQVDRALAILALGLTNYQVEVSRRQANPFMATLATWDWPLLADR